MSTVINEKDFDQDQLSYRRSKTNDSSYVLKYGSHTPRIRFTGINMKNIITGSKTFTKYKSGKQSGKIFIKSNGYMKKVFTKMTDKLYEEYFGVDKKGFQLKPVLTLSLNDNICKALWVKGENKKVSFTTLMNILKLCSVDMDISALSFWITKDGYDYDNYYKNDKKHKPNPSKYMIMTYYVNSIHINGEEDIDKIKNMLKMDSGIIDLPKVDKSRLNILKNKYVSNNEIVRNIMTVV